VIGIEDLEIQQAFWQLLW
jgi:hypothetical protein